MLAHTEAHLDPNSDLIDIAPLGEGAFATVVLCKPSKRDAFSLHSHAAKSGLVAAKRLKPKCVAEEPLEFDNFLSEAALVKTLVHKNVIECYGCIEYRDKHEGTHCAVILLEYLQGGSLRARISRRDYDGAQALRWLIEIAEGMTYLHTVADIGIAHRDLKPDNILLDEHGVAKIADMGMARIAIRAPSGSPASVTCRTGTPRYMAPENWAGESYTYKVDVFSYGILAYELLSGKRAYGELVMNGQEVADAVAEQGLRPTIPGSWPDALVALLRACWSTDPTERPDFTHVAPELLRIEALSKDNPALISKLVRGHREPHPVPKGPCEPSPPRSTPLRSTESRASTETQSTIGSLVTSSVSPGTKADKSKAVKEAKQKQKPGSSMCVIS
ncbi:kinase-like domain-containing protein [Pavlovales sp. CCMP2436]|nr:kinase-like domain-containing protein [Pavlovales sp. CCMP2436]